MFREMVRKKQQLSQEACIRLLTEEPRGILSVIGDEGYPYALPMDHSYCPEDGVIYFHSGSTGHKIDAIRRCDKASFCVCDQGYREEGDWALNIRSVIVFGRVRIIEDPERAVHITQRLSYKYTQDAAYIEDEIQKYSAGLLVFALTPEHISGKITKES